MNKHSRIVVIGVGQDFRSDDAVGLVVARSIAEANLPGVRTVMGVADGTSMISAWESADAAYVIDCMSSGDKPGTIRRFDAVTEEIPFAVFRNCSTHCFGIASTVRLAEVLDQLPPRLVIYGIEGSDFAMGQDMSVEVNKAAHRIIHEITVEIESQAS